MSGPPRCLYTETRLGSDPARASNAVELVLPTINTPAFASRASPKRRRVDRAPLQDEATFASRHLATQAGIHFRPNKSSTTYARPRSVLWRLLENNNALELQAVDLYERREIDSTSLTLRFIFPSSIIPGGVAFVESQVNTLSSPSLLVFAITKAGELFWLKLRKEAFTKSSVLEDSTSSDWCKSYAVPALYSRRPYRICSNGESELWVSLDDGSLLRLQKQQNDTWSETYLSETSWTLAIRRLNLFQGHATVTYGDIDLNVRSAAAIALSPDEKHVWTVCLDHTLRAWNVADGTVAVCMDLSGDTSRDLKKPADCILDPHASSLLEILPSKGSDSYQLVIFSPSKQEFKFWTVRDPDSPEHGIHEAHTDFSFVPPVEESINTSAWTMDRFCIRTPVHGQGKDWSLWMLVRSGTRSHTLNVAFNPDASKKKVQHAWKTQWKECSKGMSAEEMKTRLDCPIGYSTEHDVDDITDRWIDFLFQPGRFSHATLQTAIVVYSRILGQKSRPGLVGKENRREPLQEQLCRTVGSAVTLDTIPNEGASYHAYTKAIGSQWEIFYGVVQDLQKQRERPLDLSLDPSVGLPWLVMTDQTSPIRRCSEMEILWHNRNSYAQLHSLDADSVLLNALGDSADSGIGQFFAALAFFRSALPKPFVASFNSSLRREVLAPAEEPPSVRMQALYDETGFAGRVSDEDYNTLTDLLESFGGFSQLSNEFFSGILARLGEDQQGSSQDRGRTPYGSRMLIKGAQDTLQLSEEVALDLVLLVVFMACELDPSDLPETFDGYELYGALLTKMRELSLLSWLATTSVIVGRSPQGDTIRSDAAPSMHAANETYLELCCIDEWKIMRTPKLPEDELLTYWIRAWTFGSDVINKWDIVTATVMALLLQNGDLQRAAEFLRFLGHIPWASYIKARFYLASGEFEEAASLFREASRDLSSNFNVETHDTQGLVAVDERNHFNDGLTSFFQHVAALFEKARAMSYVADFATLALKAYNEETYEDHIREDLQSRLFTAYIETCRLSDAFATLVVQKNQTLRRPSLRQLLASALANSQVDLLLSFDWPDDLAEDVDAYLSSLCAPDASATSPPSSPPPHQILYAWRVARSDFRGAAACTYERLEVLRVDAARGIRGADIDDEREATFIAVLNCLALVDDSMQWLLVRKAPVPPTGRRGRLMIEDGEPARAKRCIVTLDDVRREWQEELDRVADVKAGRVPFGFDEDVDGEAMDAMPGAFRAGSGAFRAGSMEVDVFAS